MPWDAGNINILHARSVRKTRTETTQQIAVPHGIPWISGKRQPPSDIIISVLNFPAIKLAIVFIHRGSQMSNFWHWPRHLVAFVGPWIVHGGVRHGVLRRSTRLRPVFYHQVRPETAIWGWSPPILTTFHYNFHYKWLYIIHPDQWTSININEH